MVKIDLVISMFLNRQQMQKTFIKVCNKAQQKYDKIMIQNIDQILLRDKNAIIGINFDTDIMLWCCSSRIGRCKYKFIWADECVNFKSVYVPFKHLRCSSCDLLNQKFPCYKNYHFFANIKVHFDNIIKYMVEHQIKYKIEV